MKTKLLYWGALLTLVFLCLPVTALATDNPVGVAYRGHIQDLGDYPLDGSWIDSPEIIGTTGQSKRIEGFLIKLTGEVPADLQNGLELRYNVHVQNKGWLYDENDVADWPKDGAYAGTRGESLRIEAVKLVLTDSDGQPVPGYSVQYRGHVQDIGDLPADKSQWLADGQRLGTVGSSLRLEALQVQVVKTTVDPPEPQVYDQAGTYGPTSGTETIAGDVTVAADGVTLQNQLIEGNLTISEAVGDGTVTLNNVTVKGDTLVRGGGIHSIKINGGQYSRIIMEKTASGAVRIVATGADGLDVVIAEDASGETIILEGAFASVTVNAPDMIVTTQGNTTTIGTMTVGADGGGSTLNLATGTTVADLVLDGKAAVKGQGSVVKAAVKADGVVFEKKPGAYTVEPDVIIPPVFPTPNPGGGGGPTTITVSSVSLNKNSTSLKIGDSETLTATVAPANATNKAVSFSSSDPAVATVDAGTGLVTAVAVGTARITVTTADGSKQASCDVTVDPIAVTSVNLTPATLDLVYGDTANLTATVEPANATNQAVSFSSSNPAVAKVDQSGKVTAVYAGKATITASSQADSAIKATCEVTVQGRLKIKQSRAVAGSDADNFVLMTLEGDTFISGNNDFDFKPGDTGLDLSYSGPSDQLHRCFNLINIAKPGTLTLQATGLTSGVKSNIVSIMVLQPVVSVTLDKETADLTEGYTLPLSATVLPTNAVNRTVSWTSDTPGVATVDANGTVTGLLPGTAIITAKTANGVQDTCTVTVKPVIETSGTETEVTITKYNGNDQNVVIPATINGIPVTSIGAGAFSGKTTVKSVDIPDTVTSIGANAFYKTGLSGVTIPAAVTSIGADAFYECSSITNLNFAGTPNLQTIGARAFRGCGGLSNVVIPSTVTSIGEDAFMQCKLTSLTFADNSMLQTIGTLAFFGCSELATVTIPKSVTSIGDQAFADCQGLKTVTFLGGATSPQTLVEATFSDCKALETVSFEANTMFKSLPANAFWGCSGLQRVIFSDGLETMGFNAFSGCPATLVLRFYGDAPSNDASAIPAGTTIEYLDGKANFVPARFPACTIQTFTL